MRHRHSLFTRACLAALLVLASAPSQAGITLSSTRVIFDGNKRDASISVGNASNRAYAVQAWVNTEADDNNIAAPFIATPPLFRLDPRKEQMVRIVRTAGELPSDRESVFYFNAQEIPAASEGDENTLKVAVRTRLKLFFRPKGLESSLLEALPALRWSVVQVDGKPMLEVHNPSAFHVSFIDIKVAAGSKVNDVDAQLMVAPFASRQYRLPTENDKPEAVTFSVINDYGGYTEPRRVALSAAR
ncbi:fimbrial biogenesis chaperone [Pseudomonas akapageensis]|uniref:fimbrial biogenesis chaperone n=1 Tax=Pseudomonas akapageensis TaxID=2609961 RepID=UPI00140CEF27|nr:molecular chaperone [Pseudomonas akapageensis]